MLKSGGFQYVCYCIMCTSLKFINPSAWSDEHCSSCCMLALIHLYLDNIGSKCNQTASCLFMKELALIVWERVARNYFFVFSLLSKFGLSFCSP